MIKIIQKENDTLRRKCEEVPLGEIKNNKIQKILSNMKTALDSQDDGVAIAAPQIGVSLRIFVVAGKVFSFGKETKDEQSKPIPKEPDMIFINPRIIKESKETAIMEEGCLSVRWLYGKVNRAKKVKIEAYNENGQKFTYGSSGLMAQIFQHETDHLDGILFTDKATELKDMPPEPKKKIGTKK